MLRVRFRKGVVMQPIGQSSIQLPTLFGNRYIAEQRGDETRRYLPPSEKYELAVDFDEVIKALRAALSLQ
jgi:hypothetical protein